MDADHHGECTGFVPTGHTTAALPGVEQMGASSGAQVLQWTDNGTTNHLW